MLKNIHVNNQDIKEVDNKKDAPIIKQTRSLSTYYNPCSTNLTEINC